MNHLLVRWAKLVQAAEEEVYYHGFSGRPGHERTEIVPHSQLPDWHQRMSPVTFPADTDPDYAYATKDPSSAWSYAEKAWHSTSKGVPRVVRVRPRGPVEEDPHRDQRGELRGNYAGDVRSRHGFDVVGEEKMPEDMGEPEDWR